MTISKIPIRRTGKCLCPPLGVAMKRQILSLCLFKTPGCADLIGITPFNKKTYPSHHSNTLSNTKIFIDQTYSSHTSNCGRSTHQNVRTGHHASASTPPSETSAEEVTVLRAATEDCHFPGVRSPIYSFKNSYISPSNGGHPST